MRPERSSRPLTDPSARPAEPGRRTLLGAGAAAVAAGLLGAGGTAAARPVRADGRGAAAASGDVPPGYVTPGGPHVRDAEKRRGNGPVRQLSLLATPALVQLGGRTVRTWAYDGSLTGPEMRVTAGDTLAVDFANNLPHHTTVHWHGVALRNDMDGVPGITQAAVAPGASFPYRFMVVRPGTYWYHPHVGVQQDRGLYGPLIVDDPREPLAYDKEWVVVLDDWVDGIDGSDPDAILKELNHGMSHGGHEMRAAAAPEGPSRILKGSHSELLGGEAGNVDYPLHLINGRTADDPETFTAAPGDRIRIRLINAGGDTAYRVALGGHTMTITHTDGHPVEHADTDTLLLGMSERYDVLVTAKDGAFPLTALAEGKKHLAQAVLRTGGGSAPGPGTRPRELDGKLVTAPDLYSAESVRLPERDVERRHQMVLTGSMGRFNWAINHEPFTPSQRYAVREGERVQLVFRNHTRMWHPMHLHGHAFELADGGPRKDTVSVRPGRTVRVHLDADNPGLWMLHCHNVYHSESGMMTVLGYRD
ncbi:multicopper oxidase family protein [Streptomyces sp. NBC_01525]|uniref:multicopper oxidase family protein n=1 Tax=Streptomyces sp. NBC_01525 TaxID=2903893 RepID=UPI00386F31CC